MKLPNVEATDWFSSRGHRTDAPTGSLTLTGAVYFIDDLGRDELPKTWASGGVIEAGDTRAINTAGNEKAIAAFLQSKAKTTVGPVAHEIEVSWSQTNPTTGKVDPAFQKTKLVKKTPAEPGVVTLAALAAAAGARLPPVTKP